MPTDQTKPTASVLLPAYNAERYVDEAIESVLGQDFERFELLLLNDGSTDDTLSHLEYFAARDKRCKIHSWPNQGLIATLNAGVQLANADILIRMDHDDVCRPGRFAKQIAYMDEHPECVALGSKVMLIDPDGYPIAEFATEIDHDKIDAALMAGKGGAIAHPAAVIRKDAIIKVGGYRASYPHAEDIDLFLRLAEVGRLANLGDVLLDYRQHLSSIGYHHTKMQQESARSAVMDAYRRRGIVTIPLWASKSEEDQLPSLISIYRKWGWWSLRGGNVKTARKYAWKALLSGPFDTESLKLVACTYLDIK